MFMYVMGSVLVVIAVLCAGVAGVMAAAAQERLELAPCSVAEFQDRCWRAGRSMSIVSGLCLVAILCSAFGVLYLSASEAIGPRGSASQTPASVGGEICPAVDEHRGDRTVRRVVDPLDRLARRGGARQ